MAFQNSGVSEQWLSLTLQKCLSGTFTDSHFQNHTKEKRNCPVFVNMKSVFWLPVFVGLEDSFPYIYMSCLWSQIWSNHVWRSWCLIIRLEITVQSSAMDFYTVTFFKLTLGSDCLELFFWAVDFKKPSSPSNITKIPVAFKPEL